MHTTSVLSLSWREGGPELLARCTAPLEERPALLTKLATELRAEEVIYLVTCNRVEVAYRSPRPLSTEDARRGVIAALDPGGLTNPKSWRAWVGEGAVEHLLLVAAGLTSAKVGETEIAGQLRDAQGLSRDLGLAGGPLGDFIDEALRCARSVRKETSLSEGRTSLAEIALERLRSHRRELPSPYRVGLIGRSSMTERIARALATGDCQLHWANRTSEKIEGMAQEVGATVYPLKDFQACPAEVDAIVCATGSTTPILGQRALELAASAGTSLIVDLSVAPDVRSEDAAAVGIAHFGLEEILHLADQTRSEKASAAAEARVLVDDALEQLSTRHRERTAGQAASRLHERFRSDAAQAAEDALRREFKHLPQEDAERLRKFTDLLARRLAHAPAKSLRRLAADHGQAAAERFLDEASNREEPS